MDRHYVIIVKIPCMGLMSAKTYLRNQALRTSELIRWNFLINSFDIQYGVVSAKKFNAHDKSLS